MLNIKRRLKQSSLVLFTTSMLFTLVGCSQNSLANNMSNKSTTSQVKNADSNKLADLNYEAGQSAYVNVNNGKATISAKNFSSVHVDYANLDQLNRTSGNNTAYLDSRNVANDSLRVAQTVRPTGWHQKFVNNEAILNRGHEIAYSLSKGIDVDGKYNPQGQSGDQNNPKNLFTQTAFSNQKVQTIFESKVRNALKSGKKVVYQVTPVFRGNELMARGVHMQAISTDGTLNFNVYLFNVQPGIKFNYTDGTSKVDSSMNVPTPVGAPTFNDNKQSSENTAYHTTYHRHHYVRDYLIYRGVKHVVAHHFGHHRF